MALGNCYKCHIYLYMRCMKPRKLLLLLCSVLQFKIILFHNNISGWINILQWAEDVCRKIFSNLNTIKAWICSKPFAHFLPWNNNIVLTFHGLLKTEVFNVTSSWLVGRQYTTHTSWSIRVHVSVRVGYSVYTWTVCCLHSWRQNKTST